MMDIYRENCMTFPEVDFDKLLLAFFVLELQLQISYMTEYVHE